MKMRKGPAGRFISIDCKIYRGNIILINECCDMSRGEYIYSPLDMRVNSPYLFELTAEIDTVK